MNDQITENLLELLLELGARAKRAERTVAMQTARIKELEEAAKPSEPAPLRAVDPPQDT